MLSWGFVGGDFVKVHAILRIAESSVGGWDDVWW